MTFKRYSNRENWTEAAAGLARGQSSGCHPARSWILGTAEWSSAQGSAHPNSFPIHLEHPSGAIPLKTTSYVHMERHFGYKEAHDIAIPMYGSKRAA